MILNSNNNFPFLVSKYLKKIPEQFKYPLCSLLSSNKRYSNIVIIPIFSEYKYIFKTLEKLSIAIKDAKEQDMGDTLIILSINNPKSENQEPRRLLEQSDRSATQITIRGIKDNQKLLKLLNTPLENIDQSTIEKENLRLIMSLNINWIDASSKGCELSKDLGVGGGRKIGMDAALYYCDWSNTPLLFSLDADTIVEKNYITAIREYFDSNNKAKSAAIVNFIHQKGQNVSEEKAIRLYEEYLHDYVDNLRKSNSPYSYHSIGSAIICNAKYYVKSGGMRPRAAAEDFYFLQALCKVGSPPHPIGEITTTTIYPSARTSNRVPFGTGPKVAKYAEDSEDINNIKIFYNPKIFKLLNQLFNSVEENLFDIDINKWLDQLPHELIDFLTFYKFHTIWKKIITNTPKNPKKIKWAFYTWFDAFKILKFIHFCEAEPYKYPKLSRNELINSHDTSSTVKTYIQNKQ